MQPYILLCTVGTSLKKNLEDWYKDKEKTEKKLDSFTPEDWEEAAQYIYSLDPHERPCGAEINSIQAMMDEGHVTERPEIHLFHSDTGDGEDIACLLERICNLRGFHGHRVQLHRITGLRDSNPREFSTRGLRNLVRTLCDSLHKYGPSACAINATGGYKAQIAIAVMIGQALEVPVFYKHEFFREHSIIRFPPLPVTLDEQVWLKHRSFFQELCDADDFVPAAQYAGELEEMLESLIERETQDGEEFLHLSPAGLLLHEQCKDRYKPADETAALPEARAQRLPQIGGDHCASRQAAIQAYMQKVTDGNPFVVACRAFYCNPDLPLRNHFRHTPRGVTGVYSDSSFTAKFSVETTAESEAQKGLAVEKLNQWLKANPRLA